MLDVVLPDMQIAYPLGEIHSLAKQLIEIGKNQPVWTLQGSMGSGKTTLVKALMATCGVRETVASPTFSIVNEYTNATGQPIYHFDFYRIKNEIEAFDIGTEEYIESGNWCLIEWPEKIQSLLPPTYFELHLELIDANRRLIRYQKHG